MRSWELLKVPLGGLKSLEQARLPVGRSEISLRHEQQRAGLAETQPVFDTGVRLRHVTDRAPIKLQTRVHTGQRGLEPCCGVGL